MPVRLHHIVVDAHDLPRLARFWTQALGWKVLSEREREIVIGADDHAPIGMCFMPVTDPKTVKIVHIDVHASQIQAPSDPVIQFAVQASQDVLPRRADRSAGQRDEVQVTDTGDVVPGGEGTGHHQAGHPLQARKPAREMTHRRWYVPHPVSRHGIAGLAEHTAGLDLR